MAKPDGKESEARGEVNTSRLSLRAIARGDLVRLLSESGAKLATKESVAGDVAAGLPVNADGTHDLIAVAAWLVNETK